MNTTHNIPGRERPLQTTASEVGFFSLALSLIFRRFLHISLPPPLSPNNRAGILNHRAADRYRSAAQSAPGRTRMNLLFMLFFLSKSGTIIKGDPPPAWQFYCWTGVVRSKIVKRWPVRSWKKVEIPWYGEQQYHCKRSYIVHAPQDWIDLRLTSNRCWASLRTSTGEYAGSSCHRLLSWSRLVFLVIISDLKKIPN